jgi:hypothetical protein
MNSLKEDFNSGIIKGFQIYKRLNLIAQLEKMIDSFSHDVEFRDPDKHQLIRLLDNDKELLALHLQVIKYTNLIFDNILIRDIHQELLAETHCIINYMKKSLRDWLKCIFRQIYLKADQFNWKMLLSL